MIDVIFFIALKLNTYLMKNLNKTKYLHSVSIIKFNSCPKILMFGFFLKITIFLDLNPTQSNRNSSGGTV